jgi:hypothetical protein
MTPKEKAEELFEKYYQWNFINFGVYCTLTAKQCALICVDEILTIGCIEVPYWLEVNQEIEKL